MVNSKKVNQSLLDNCQHMFDLEFDIKMKAQLKYMEVVEKRKERKGIWQAMKHDYLWSPTSTYYVGATFAFLLMKRRIAL